MKTAVIWFRRDLRVEDNRALQQALLSGSPVMPLFIFDHEILDELPRDDPRVTFIYDRLENLHRWFRSRGSSLVVKYGKPVPVWQEIINEYQITGVYLNKDYEPYAVERDRNIELLLGKHGISLYRFRDQVIFGEDEILTLDKKPYTVFTAYKRRWLERFTPESISAGSPLPADHFLPMNHPFPSLSDLGFKKSSIRVEPYDLSKLDQYARVRDYPASDATSHLSPHLRFGTVSIRQIVATLKPSHEIFLAELIWREFFMQILHHFPRVVDQNFKKRYDGIEWRNDTQEFNRWCNGETGYPLVDAGMRQLNEAGTMHNRVRMVTASFLCKHLLIDWRWGEAYFAGKLLDFELSSNNGNWQWVAGTGCDAAPYFRIFNPHEQMKKFDKDQEYVRRWIPDYRDGHYIKPVVEHRYARTRALEVYRKGIIIS